MTPSLSTELKRMAPGTYFFTLPSRYRRAPRLHSPARLGAPSTVLTRDCCDAVGESPEGLGG